MATRETKAQADARLAADGGDGETSEEITAAGPDAGESPEDWQARAHAAESELAAHKSSVATASKPDPNGPPPFFLVRESHPNAHKRILFRSVDESRARGFLLKYFPRGSGAYIELPDGSFEHHEMERQGDWGVSADAWGAFDPETYKPPEEAEPPGESAWSDRLG